MIPDLSMTTPSMIHGCLSRLHMSLSRLSRRTRLTMPLSAAIVVPAVAALALGGCGGAAKSDAAIGGDSAAGAIVAIGAENEYADMIKQIGGRYVKVSAVMSNPNSDPHSFEASPSIAQTVSAAKLIVQNGVGYDDFMTDIENASPSSARKVVTVQHVLGLPDSTANPHLWYDPQTMPKLVQVLVGDLAALEPRHASYFKANAVRFDGSLNRWDATIAAFKQAYPHVPVATTEPVADYLLQALGTDNLTPFTLQTAIMNGTDPSAQDITAQEKLFTDHKVKVFVYNQQVTDTLTESFLKLARQNGIPVVGVYETMPTPGYSYQSWMQAELKALREAVTDKVSTTRLVR
jgi:zinc/manganese transport system substrate-binding protein